MRCECVEDCADPFKCDNIPPCCPNYLCPYGYYMNAKGSCIRQMSCGKKEHSVPINKAFAFLPVGLCFPPHFNFGKIEKKKKIQMIAEK